MISFPARRKASSALVRCSWSRSVASGQAIGEQLHVLLELLGLRLQFRNRIGLSGAVLFRRRRILRWSAGLSGRSCRPAQDEEGGKQRENATTKLARRSRHDRFLPSHLEQVPHNPAYAGKTTKRRARSWQQEAVSSTRIDLPMCVSMHPLYGGALLAMGFRSGIGGLHAGRLAGSGCFTQIRNGTEGRAEDDVGWGAMPGCFSRRRGDTEGFDEIA